MRQLLLVCLLFAGCQKHASFTIQNLDIQGHRGARGLMPENTIPAFVKALDLKANTSEMDTYISKDGLVVLSHDPFFIPEITLTPHGKTITTADEQRLTLFKMDYALTRSFDVGSKSYPEFPQQKKSRL